MEFFKSLGSIGSLKDLKEKLGVPDNISIMVNKMKELVALIGEVGEGLKDGIDEKDFAAMRNLLAKYKEIDQILPNGAAKTTLLNLRQQALTMLGGVPGAEPLVAMLNAQLNGPADTTTTPAPVAAAPAPVPAAAAAAAVATPAPTVTPAAPAVSAPAPVVSAPAPVVSAPVVSAPVAPSAPAVTTPSVTAPAVSETTPTATVAPTEAATTSA